MDATLPARCRSAFPLPVRQQGETAVRERRVVVLPEFDDGFMVVVESKNRRESNLVDIRLQDLPDGVLHVECTCSQPHKPPLCSHVWAAIVQFDREFGFSTEDWDDLVICRINYDEDEDDEDVAPYRARVRERFNQNANEADKEGPNAGGNGASTASAPEPASRPMATWRHQLARIRQSLHDHTHGRTDPVSSSADTNADPRFQHRYWFALKPEYDHRVQPLTLHLYRNIRLINEPWSDEPQPVSRDDISIDHIPDSAERLILGALLASNDIDSSAESGWDHGLKEGDSKGLAPDEQLKRVFETLPPDSTSRVKVPPSLVNTLLPRMAELRRLAWIQPSTAREAIRLLPLAWDDGPAFRVQLEVTALPASDDDVSREPAAGKSEARKSAAQQQGAGEQQEAGGDMPATPTAFAVQLWLERDGERLPAKKAIATFEGGLLLLEDRIARIQAADMTWVNLLRSSDTLEVHQADLPAFLEQLGNMPYVPRLTFHEQLGIVQEQGTPRGQLNIDQAEPVLNRFTCYPTLYYGEQEIGMAALSNLIWDGPARKLIQRDKRAEELLLSRLPDLNMRSEYRFSRPVSYWFMAAELPGIVRCLTDEGWTVVAQGKRIRGGGQMSARVTTGIDWFDVDAKLCYGDAEVAFPRVLEALRNRDELIRLDDGTHGLLPEAWLRRFAGIAGLGREQDEHVRFHRSQALLLEALLAEQEQVEKDRDFTELCQKLSRFDGIKPAEAPAGFQGTLRSYQREGLAWLQFLEEFQLGGCLADDMGLGKTIQVLSLLEARRRVAKKRSKRQKSTEPQGRTSLVVVPKSLIFNWLEEAKRFTPELNVIDYTGPQRHEVADQLGAADVVLTTYGTLRRDIESLREVVFEYAILDEATAIKNYESLTAKAARLIQAKHRLAMTGTPVENHLGELWSLFEFLNPGMLGRHVSFQQLVSASQSDVEALEMLRTGLRPFILRRTKEQVLTELPEKSEQTLYCDMPNRQRKIYDELRDHFRDQVTSKVKQIGLNRAKMHVLEALLRLRQAACDPRLIDENESPGAKIEVLMERLDELVERGHKALVFSQFTSLLSLVRQSIEHKGWEYAYLDGRTRRRQECVERFQQDPACQLFLISLKAGGHGLNLTAADYVFILDPWWNPAIEAQAVDRAHRLGQTRRVMAYRIICRDTVEDKILQLQQTKREVADAIVSADKSLIGTLTADELQVLLR